MNAPPLTPCRPPGRLAWARVAKMLLYALPLAACGGRSHDSQAPESVAGASAGGADPGAGMGGQSNAGTAGAAAQWRAFCWNWSELENEPKPGQSGIAACPDFNELKFVVKYTCWYSVPEPSPIPPDAATAGDCCYAVFDFNCR